MDFETLLKSSDSTSQLKCKVCNNLLSYFPVHSSSSGDDLNVCGRCCTEIDDQHRNKAYETVAQVIHFPCRFEGCDERLLPRDMPRHEQICLYKTIKCPVQGTTQCDWTGPFNTALEHCQDQHEDLTVEDNEFQVDLTSSYQREILLQYNGSVLIFSFGYDTTNSVFQFSVYHIEEEVKVENFNYEISLKNDKTSIVEKSITTSWNERTTVEVPLHILLRHNKLIANGEINVGHLVDGMEDEKVISDEILTQMVCSVCTSYALPPIHHTGNLLKCSKCAGGDSIRINTLDNIAALLNYPCKNRTYGCTQVLNAGEMENHQKICGYGNYRCITRIIASVPCQWLGLQKDMVGHIQAEHQDMIIENNSETTVQYTAEALNQRYMIIHEKRLFVLLFTVDKARNKRLIEENQPNEILKLTRSYRWMPLTSTIDVDFVCEIEVTDGGNSGRKLTASRPCKSLWSFAKDVRGGSVTGADWCCFTWDQIHAVNDVDDQITFKVSISKL